MIEVGRRQVDTGADDAMLSHLRSAIEEEFRSLTLAFTADEIRRMLRVEVDQAHEFAILRASPIYWLHSAERERDGPWTFEGVDVYAVRKLPDPGWRVVNPFQDACGG